MYRIYNSSTNTYGIDYRKQVEAMVMAHAYSLWTQTERAVVDVLTGEILAIYNNGKETYRAEA